MGSRKYFKFLKSLKNSSKRSLIYITLIVLTLDVIFVAINYYASKKALRANLLDQATEYQREFDLTLQMTYRNMMQMALFISQNNTLNQLFLKGKKAVEQEGGGPGGKITKKYRQQLLEQVKPAWDRLTEKYDIRQLHYHLGPGSLSYLRVHKPQKYGDRMDNLRHIIVDTNAEKTPRAGFETGRIYSGLRGVYPILTVDPATNKMTYVGALETGTSFKQLLPMFAKAFDINVAVLLTKPHIENKMWPEFINQYFKNNPDIDYYIEATSNKNIKNVLLKTPINKDFKANSTHVIKLNDQYLSVYYFPLRDYQAARNKNMPASGFILVWENVTDLVKTFYKSFLVNILFGIFGFLVIEAALIWFMDRERKFMFAKREAHFDGLTNVYNRRSFNQKLADEISRTYRNKQPLSLLICDIDFFKKYNDTYGHQAGDECLQKVAQTIKANARRKFDFVARYGGEEFVCLLPNTDLTTAIEIANQVKEAVYSLNLPHAGSTIEPRVTLSIGTACTKGEINAKQLINSADKNLYLAKEYGRNQVQPIVKT